MKTKSQALEEALSTGGERALSAFLKANPFILTKSLRFLGSPNRVIAEFPIGTEYHADFLVVAPSSGAMELHLIEVKPPSCPFFNRNLVLSKHANKALMQIQSWKTYIERNQQQFIHDLERYSRERDLLHKHAIDDLTCTSGLSVHHPKMNFFYTYTILMGRRHSHTTEMLERKVAFTKTTNISLVSCDRLFIGADEIDRNPAVYADE